MAALGELPAGDLLPWLILVVAALGLYGVWSVGRDGRRGVNSSRGLRFSRRVRPGPYRAVMALNSLAVILLLFGVIVLLVRLLMG